MAGQSRGGSQEQAPNTFTYNPQARPEQRVQGSAQQINMQGSGGGVQGGTYNYDEGTDGTRALSGLMNIAAEKLAPVAKKLEERAYLDGMTRAAAGQTMAQVINDRPWFTKIFGDTPAVDGARAYNSQAAASKWAAESEAAMTELRKQPPEAMSNYVATSFEKFANTGDPTTDQLIRGSMVELAPKLVERQTREHIKWQQETASDARRNAWSSTSSHIQAALADQTGMYTDQDKADMMDGAVIALRPLPGADLESWENDLGKQILADAQAGNFHMIRAVEANGLLGLMRPEQRDALKKGIDQAQKAHAQTAGMEPIAQEMSMMMYKQSIGELTGSQMNAWMLEQNERYSATTGNTAQLFTGVERVRENSQAMGAYNRRAQAVAAEALRLAQLQATADDKAAAAAETRATIMGGLTQGLSPGYLTDKGLKSNEVDQVAAEMFHAAPPARKPTLMRDWALGSYEVPKALKYDLARAIDQTNPDAVSDQFLATFQLYGTLRGLPEGGTAAAAKWFSTEHIKQMDLFKAYGGGGPDPKVNGLAFQLSKRDAALTRAESLPAKERKQLETFLTDQTKKGGWFFGKFGADKANPAALQLMTNVSAHHANELRGTWQGDDLAHGAFSAMQEQVGIMGKYAYVKPVGGDQASIESLVRHKLSPENAIALNDESMAKAVNRLVQRKMEAIGLDDDRAIHMIREADVGGIGYFSLATMDEGRFMAQQFTTEELVAELNAVKVEGLDKIGQRFEPKSVGTGKAPSPSNIFPGNRLQGTSGFSGKPIRKE